MQGWWWWWSDGGSSHSVCDFRSWPCWQGCGQLGHRDGECPPSAWLGAERGRRGHADGGHGGGFGGRDTGWWGARHHGGDTGRSAVLRWEGGVVHCARGGSLQPAWWPLPRADLSASRPRRLGLSARGAGAWRPLPRHRPRACCWLAWASCCPTTASSPSVDYTSQVPVGPSSPCRPRCYLSARLGLLPPKALGSTLLRGPIVFKL